MGGAAPALEVDRHETPAAASRTAAVSIRTRHRIHISARSKPSGRAAASRFEHEGTKTRRRTKKITKRTKDTKYTKKKEAGPQSTLVRRRSLFFVTFVFLRTLRVSSVALRVPGFLS